jgi:hypothetical protein
VPVTSPSDENTASRTRSAVGRAPAGTANRRPPAVPATTRTPPRATQPLSRADR